MERAPDGACMMHHVGLFIPCYMDAFKPEVGIATLDLPDPTRSNS
jgi:hypothetical protein